MASTLNATTASGGGIIASGDSSGILQLQTGGTTAVTVDASQNVGIGTSSPTQKLNVYGSDGNNNVASFTRASGATMYVYADTGANVGFFTGSNASGSGVYANATNNTVQFNTNGLERARIDSSGNLLVGTTTVVEKLTVAGSVAATGYMYPNTDNTYSTGLSGKRWSVVYAATGTINTSDAREKTSVTPLTSAELLAAQQLAAEIGSYKWLSAIEAKGDAARKHIGMTVQRAIEIMEANGLVPFDYGFICYDEWSDSFAEDGTQTQIAGNRYSFRMDELGMFIAKGQQQLITQLTTRIAALEGAKA